MTPIVRMEEVFVLPFGFDPSEENVRMVVEPFLDYEELPSLVRIEELDDDTVAVVAVWYEEDQ